MVFVLFVFTGISCPLLIICHASMSCIHVSQYLSTSGQQIRSKCVKIILCTSGQVFKITISFSKFKTYTYLSYLFFLNITNLYTNKTSWAIIYLCVKNISTYRTHSNINEFDMQFMKSHTTMIGYVFILKIQNLILC